MTIGNIVTSNQEYSIKLGDNLNVPFAASFNVTYGYLYGIDGVVNSSSCSDGVITFKVNKVGIFDKCKIASYNGDNFVYSNYFSVTIGNSDPEPPYNPPSEEKLVIKELCEIKSVTLHKVNRDIIGELTIDFLNSLSKDISDTDTLELTIPKYITNVIDKTKQNYSLYNEVKEERHICLNDSEFYTIKKISENKGKNSKKVTAYSSEIKLAKNDIKIEDIGFYLIGKDEENDIYSLNDYMYKEVGWKFGHIDDSVRYYTDTQGVKHERLRLQESISTNWHEYLFKYIAESFDCIVVFDTKNKLVNLYSIDGFGDEIRLGLSYDGYLKDLETSTSSDNLVTRLNLYGNKDLSILEGTASGYPYIENYSYFIEGNEMSNSLINALRKYEEMVAKRTTTWNELRKQKSDKQLILTNKKVENSFIMSEIDSLESQIKIYKSVKDVINEAKKLEELKIQKDKFVILKNEIDKLEEEVNLLQDSINEINKLCKRETCTDDSGSLIFDQFLLDELKEFIYNDEYTNDSILNVEDLLKTGNRQLDLSCKPTKEWSVDSVNFIDRLLDDGFRSHFKGVIGLGNVISLIDDDDIEELVYFVGFTKNFKSKTLELNLSDKKIKCNNKRVVGDLLHSAKKSLRQIDNNKHLWMDQKYNRMNFDNRKWK